MAESCTRCGKEKVSQGSGSITQWIAACNCEALLKNPTEDDEVRKLCKVCGKKIAAGRSGSLTQWVFRSDSCQCERPAPSEGFMEPQQPTDESQTSSHSEEYPEIHVDPNLFPQDRYKPLLQLGFGAAGEVFLCRDLVLAKKVAVKTLRQVTPEQLIAFQNEAKATSALNHPNIVTIIDFGVSGSGAPYMVLDYTAGTNLENYLNDNGYLPWTLALELTAQLCGALAYAHERKIFHRDLKPSNVLLSDAGGSLQVRLIDFGVAQMMKTTELPQAFQGNTIVGTPMYMSPDQIAGKTFDARSEIYSLGCMLFECLSGAPPFSADTPMETLSLHATEIAPTLLEVNEDLEVPPEVEMLVARCLEKIPEERFQTMTELKQAIEATLQPAMVPESAEDAYSRKQRRSKNLVLFLGPLAIITMFGLFAFFNSRHEPEPRKSRVEPASVTKDELSLGNELTSAFGKVDSIIDRQVKEVGGSTKFARIRNIGSVGFDGLPSTSDMDLEDLKDRKLEYLRIQYTKVTGSGFHHLKDCGINRLNLDSSPVSDEYVGQLNMLKELRYVTFDNTKVTMDGLRKLTGLKELISLNVCGCPGVEGQALAELATMFPHLEEIVLGGAEFDHLDLTQFRKFKNIRSVEVASAKVTQAQCAILASLPLQSVRMDMTNMNDASLLEFTKCKSLRFISVLGGGITPGAVAKLKKALPKLHVNSGQSIIDVTSETEGKTKEAPSDLLKFFSGE